MTDKSNPEHAPWIHLSTALAMAGTDLIEMAGAITERGSADHHKLERASKAARKVIQALCDYERGMVADPVIDWPRTSYHSPATGKRCEESGLGKDGMVLR